MASMLPDQGSYSGAETDSLKTTAGPNSVGSHKNMSEGFWNRSLPSNIWEITRADVVYERLKEQENKEQVVESKNFSPLMGIQLQLNLEIIPQNSFPKPWDRFNNNYNRFNNSASESSRSSFSSRTRTFSGSSTSSNTLLNICTYCRNNSLPYYGHTKDSCFALASLHPCRICFASGADNHTATYCPLKPKVLLQLKPEYVVRYLNRRRAAGLPIV